MSDSIQFGTEQPVEIVSTPEGATTPEAPGQEQEQPKSDGHPAWEQLQKELDPITWETKVKPFLAQQDAEVQKRFQSNAEEFGWAKELKAAGHAPEAIQQAITLAQAINQNPAEVYQYLGEHLQRTGQMPTPAQVDEALSPDAETPDDEPVSALQQQLQQQQEQFQQYIAYQEQQRLEMEEDRRTETELSALKAAHPEYTKEDFQEIIQKAIALGQTTGTIPDLATVDQAYQQHLTRIRQNPTPGDTAPTLLPTGGGVPTSAPKISLGKLTDQQVQDFIAQGLSQS